MDTILIKEHKLSNINGGGGGDSYSLPLILICSIAMISRFGVMVFNATFNNISAMISKSENMIKEFHNKLI